MKISNSFEISKNSQILAHEKIDEENSIQIFLDHSGKTLLKILKNSHSSKTLYREILTDEKYMSIMSNIDETVINFKNGFLTNNLDNPRMIRVTECPSGSCLECNSHPDPNCHYSEITKNCEISGTFELNRYGKCQEISEAQKVEDDLLIIKTSKLDKPRFENVTWKDERGTELPSFQEK